MSKKKRVRVRKKVNTIVTTCSIDHSTEEVIGGALVASDEDEQTCLDLLRKKGQKAGYKKLVDLKVTVASGSTTAQYGTIMNWYKVIMTATPVGPKTNSDSDSDWGSMTAGPAAASTDSDSGSTSDYYKLFAQAQVYGV